MGFWQYYWHFLGSAFSTPWNIAATITAALAIILGIVVWRLPKWEATLKHLLWIVPLIIFVIFAPIGWITATYDIYKEEETQIATLQANLLQEREQHKPVLALDFGNITIDNNTEKQVVTFTIHLMVRNIGDNPAYQLQLRRCAAPLEKLEKISAFPDSHETNPIFVGIPLYCPIGFWISYVRLDNGCYEYPSQILIYIGLKYSDASSGGNWYEQPYWFTYDVNESLLSSISPKDKLLFEPFVNGIYSNQTK
jgi:hypothetical protein